MTKIEKLTVIHEEDQGIIICAYCGEQIKLSESRLFDGYGESGKRYVHHRCEKGVV